LNYHQTVLQLSPTLFAQLLQIVQPCVQQINAVNQQAAAIIQAAKSTYKGAARGSPNAMVPPPPQALADLEAQRKSVILTAADSIATAFGPAQFAYFETVVRRYIGSNYQVSAATAAAAP
jgi:hypothetical protein